MIKAAIFDMDGVLVDTMEAHFYAWIRFFEGIGFKGFDKQKYKEFIGMQTSEIMAIYKEKYGLDIDVEKDSRKKEGLVDISKISSYPNVKAALEKLKKKGFKLAVATSAMGQVRDARLSQFDLNKYFDDFVCSDDVVHSKPDPGIFLAAAKKLHVLPKDCVVVEDAVTGIMAAKAAGMKCIAITTTFSRKRLKQADADLIVDDIIDVTSENISKL